MRDNAKIRQGTATLHEIARCLRSCDTYGNPTASLCYNGEPLHLALDRIANAIISAYTEDMEELRKRLNGIDDAVCSIDDISSEDIDYVRRSITNANGGEDDWYE